MTKLVQFITLTVVLAVALPSAAEGRVVFGSWVTPELAVRAQAALWDQHAIDTRVVTVDVRGRTYRRVVSPPIDRAAGDAMIEALRSSGWSAWWLAEGTPAGPSAAPEPIAAPTPRPSPPAAPVVTDEKAVERPATLMIGASDAIEVAYRPDVSVRIDGQVDEAIWAEIPSFDNMLVTEPDTLVAPRYTTHTRLVYSDSGLYVAAVMEQPTDSLIGRLSARDQFLNRDAYGITLDPSGEGLYGYWFEVNLGGSVLDGKVVPERSISEQWDGPWQSATSVTSNGWSVEMFLPWSMMTMPSGAEARRMGLWVKRKIAHLDETYSFPALPFSGARFISGFQPVGVPGIEPNQQAAIFPYASATVDEINSEVEGRAGFDFSYSPSSNLQITGAVNPDFGAVESDDVVVNLTAFETYFPEKRLFFLEGNEVFVTTPRSDVNRFLPTTRGTGARQTPSTFEPEPTTMLNTRRIGGAPRHIDIPDGVEVDGIERSRPTDLLGAVKVVGQAGGLRYGMLAAFEDDVELRSTDELTGDAITLTGPGREFGVWRALYEQTGSGRRAVGYMGTLVTRPDGDAMVHGIDGHYQSPGGKFTWDGQYLYSDVDDETGHGVFNDFRYVPRRGLIFSGALDYLDKNLDISDLGFIRRNDAVVARSGIILAKGSGLKFFRRTRNSFFLSYQANVDGFLNRLGIFTNQTYMFKNSSEVKFYLNYFPERWDDRQSRGNGNYKVDGRVFTQIAYGTDTAKPLSWSGTLTAQQEELGGWSYGSDVGFTLKPIDRLSFEFDIRYQRRDGWLVHQGDRDFATFRARDFQPVIKTDFFFNARHQLRLTLQWAGIEAQDQDFLMVPLSEGSLIARDTVPVDGDEDFTISRLTAQLRYRWELGPLSDFFAVYTRGSSLGNRAGSPFGDLFVDALEEPIVDVFVMKLRYRFGN